MKKTRVKLDSENSLLVRGERGICIYEIFYDSCMLVESEEVSQEYCVMIFYNDDNLLLQAVVNKETTEEKFRWILNKAPIEIYSEELIYVNSSNPKVKLLQPLIGDDFMKENSSLPTGCKLNSNVTIYKHTALKLDKPALIISEQNILGKSAYYISFSKYMVDGDMNDVGKIIYYDEFGNDFFSEYYYHKDMKYLFQTRFKQIQKRVIRVG